MCKYAETEFVPLLDLTKEKKNVITTFQIITFFKKTTLPDSDYYYLLFYLCTKVVALVSALSGPKMAIAYNISSSRDTVKLLWNIYN